MDARITKRRLSEMLQYDWIKIIGVIVAAILIWELIFTMTAVRVSNGQNFKIYYYPTLSTNGTTELYDFLAEDAGLSYDVLEYNIETLDATYGDTILGLRLTTGEGDIIMIDNEITHSEAEEHKDDPLYDSSNFYQMVDGYNMYSYDVLLSDAKEYVGSFIENGYVENGALVEEKVKENFLKRMKRDNRFRSAENKEKGLKQELERLETLKAAVADFDRLYTEYKDSGLFYRYVKYQMTVYTSEDVDDDYKAAYEKQLEKGALPYAINAGYLDEYKKDNKSVSNVVSMAQGDNEGTAKNTAVMVFDFKEQQPDLQYETVVFLTNFIKTYTTLLD